ncbi:interferon gamma-related-like [Xyrauchen texanus]|uniref:interferon gamma-related-like n=1 Tax=Xyrauchen texanus TaxID=154827 RepID=UPI0022420C23|nr:interferon gamma-related-like [Xyrauchen texanus]
MDSWLNILMCGLLILTLQGTNGSKLSQSKNDKYQMLKTNIHHLQEHYKTLGTEWVKSVFTSYLNKLKSKGSCTCQTVLLEGMLKIYEEIFTDMLNNSENKEVQSDLKHLKRMVQNLRHKYSVEHSVWTEIQEIQEIKVNDGTVQGGALNEFLMVFYKSKTEKHINEIN